MSKLHTMSFFSSAVFWGSIIILVGLSIVLKAVFGINIPFLRILFGVILIYWGIRLVTGWGWHRHSGSAVFSESKINYDASQKDYNIVFGSGNIDLFRIEQPATNRKIEVNVVFGSGKLILNDSIPTLVEMSSAFGSIVAPDRSVNAFGNSRYATSAYKSGDLHILIDANAVFGKLEIESKKY